MLFSPEEQYTKHGYYNVGDFKTFSKYEAYLHANTQFDQIKFNFNEHIFDKCDWSTEPQEDLYEMFKNRAIQLRNKYDYLVLMYSSGTDGRTILDTFVSNNIRLDEICSQHTTKYDEKEACFNHEVFYGAVPIVEKLGIKHRLIDLSNYLLDYTNSEEFDHMEYFANSFLCRTHRMRTFNNEYSNHMVKEYDDILKKGKTVCFIWGIEKPSISYNNESYEFSFVDVTVNRALSSYITKAPFSHENFFWTPDYPEIAIKHAHVAVNAIHNLEPSSPLLCTLHELPNSGPFIQYDKIRYLDYKQSIKVLYPKLVYDFDMDPRFRFERTHGRIFVLADRWLLKSNHESSFKYTNKLKSMFNNLKNYNYFAYRQGKLFNIKVVDGKKYTIKGANNMLGTNL